MKRNNHETFLVLFLFFLFLEIIAPLIIFKMEHEQSVNSVRKAQSADNFGSVEYPPDTDAKSSVKRKGEPTGVKSREMSPQTRSKSKNLFEPDEFSLFAKIVDPFQTMLAFATENSKYGKKREDRNDEPDGALKFRRLQMQDEKGEIPIDGLQKAREQMDKMRAFYQEQARAAGKPDGIEVAGLAPGDWRWLGPGNIGGRIRSIVIDPNNPLNIWAGSVSGGIWKSTNSGNTWQPVNDFMANLAVSTMVINPTNPAVMYAGTGEGFGNSDALQGGGIFQSTDSGVTWNLLASTNPAASNPPGCGVGSAPCSAFWNFVNRLAIAPDGTILAATNGGIARSIDGGLTWTQQTALVTTDVKFDPNNSANAIAGELTQCPNPPGPPCPGSVRRSTDGGVNWNAPITFTPQITNGGTNPTDGRVELAYAPSSSNIIYASVNQNQGDVYRSVDSGQNFNKVDIDTPTPNNLLGTVGWYANALWVNPRDPTFLLVGGVNLFQSGDSGATFALKGDSRTDSSVHVDHHVFVANPTFNDNTDKSVYFGNDGGVYRVDDIRNFSRTSGWTERNNNLGVTQFYGGAVTPNGVVFGGTQDNGTIRVSPTPNLDPPYDTENWIEFFGNDGGYVAADPTDSNYLYGEMQNMGLVRSSNGGASASFIYCNNPPNPTTGGVCAPPATGITDAFNGANFIAPFILDPNNANTMLAGGLSLWRSTDIKSAGNPTWTPIKAPDVVGGNSIPISAIAVSPINSDMIVVGHNNGDVFITSDGTSASPTWSQINIFPVFVAQRFVMRLAIDATRSPNWIYATLGGFSNNNVYVTRDLGTTWIDVSGVTGSATDLPAVPVRSIIINPANNDFLYVGTEVGIFVSQDAGATWQLPQYGPANVSVDELFLTPLGDIIAATHGRGMYTTRVPVLDLPACNWGGDIGPSCPFPTVRCNISPTSSTCCVPGNWNCPCTWNTKKVPTVTDDVAVYCPITVSDNVAARNLRVDGRLILNSGGVAVQGDLVNFGLIEAPGPFSATFSTNDLLNVRPQNAVTLRGIITTNLPITVRGDLANYGLMYGAGINVNGPAGATHKLSGNGQWNNSFLNIRQTANLTTDVVLDVSTFEVREFARLRLNGRTLTVNSNLFSNVGTVDLGSGVLNLRGNSFFSGDPNNGDTEYGIRGTGTVNVSPNSGNSTFNISGSGSGVFEPALRIQSGTVNSSFRAQMNRTLTVDQGAIFNLNEGPTTVNGDITVNGTIAKGTTFSTSDLNFNGTTFTNNGSVMIEFIQFSTTGGPRNQTIAGTGTWPASLSFQIGAGAQSTTTLMNDVTLNPFQFGVSSNPGGSVLNLGNFTLTFGGTNFAVPDGGVIGSGTLRMQPAGGTANLNATGTNPISSGVRIASGTVNASARVSGPFTIDPGARLTGGLGFLGNTFTNNGLMNSGSLNFFSPDFQTPINQQLGGTGSFAGSALLYVFPTSTTTLLNDVTFAGSQIYNEGRINTGAFTLTLPCPTGSEGPGDIIGNVRRTNLAACSGPMAFGSPFTTIQFTSGTPPTEISVNVSLTPPVGFPNAVQRTYFITPTGGSNYTANLRLHYLDSELNGNDETTLQLFRNNGTNWTAQGVTNRNTIDNWVEYSGVTQFSPWSIAALPPTSAHVSVSGQVISGGGRGVTNAFVIMTDATGQTRYVRTNPFGYYRFDEVSAGEIYVLTVIHKEHIFVPRVVLVMEEITNLNFMAEP